MADSMVQSTEMVERNSMASLAPKTEEEKALLQERINKVFENADGIKELPLGYLGNNPEENDPLSR